MSPRNVTSNFSLEEALHCSACESESPKIRQNSHRFIRNEKNIGVKYGSCHTGSISLLSYVKLNLVLIFLLVNIMSCFSMNDRIDKTNLITSYDAMSEDTGTNNLSLRDSGIITNSKQVRRSNSVRNSPGSSQAIESIANLTSEDISNAATKANVRDQPAAYSTTQDIASATAAVDPSANDATISGITPLTSPYNLPSSTCPALDHLVIVYKNSHLLGGRMSGKQSVLGDSPSVRDCAVKCCLTPSCDTALYYQQQDGAAMPQCVAITCDTEQECIPAPNEAAAGDAAPQRRQDTTVIMVRQTSRATPAQGEHRSLPVAAASKQDLQSSSSQTTPAPITTIPTAATPSPVTTIHPSEELASAPMISSTPVLQSPIASSSVASMPQEAAVAARLMSKGPNSLQQRPLVACDVGLADCPTNEYCVGFGDRRRDGACQCKAQFTRNPNTGRCEPSPPGSSNTTTAPPAGGRETVATGPVQTNTIATTNVNGSAATAATTTPPLPKVLDVTVNNKTVKLSEGSAIYEQTVTLSAYVLGDCLKNLKLSCQYEWEVLQKPESSGETTITEPHSQTITLSRLVAGTYLFSLKVTKPAEPGADNTERQPLAQGATVANLTVIRPSQSNKPPLASIVPSKQTVTLPNAAVILDGSGSEDDLTESSKLDYRWEIVTRPLGYNLDKHTGQTLKLQNLLPGNYTIMLRVTDADGLESNATAVVEVMQEKDYPPSANAGGDQIVYLPKTETLVNGSASSDDHGIVEWEWTKGPDDDGLAVDMQDTRKPLLKLAGLEEGHYQFILRVVDSSGASDTSVANVYVHPPDVTAMEANSGPDISLTLPADTATLDGRKSAGVSADASGNWTQLTGPNVARIIPSDNMLLVNVTGLTRGQYVFQLQLWSKDGTKTSKDNVTVTVKQEHNQQPKANGGGDFSVTLPVSLVQVNGSASSDDVGIVQWRWERLPTSLAAGQVLGQSGSSSVLLLTGLVTGQYQWRLTVWDDQGASDSDTVSFIVKPGPHHRDHVAVVLGAGIESVSAAQVTSLLQALKLLLPATLNLQMIEYTGLTHTGESSVILLGRDTSLSASSGDTISTAGGGGAAAGVAADVAAAAASSGVSKGVVVPGVQLASMLQAGVSTATAGPGHLFDLPVTVIQTVICQNNCSGHGECDQVRRECVCHSWWMESFARRHFGDTTPNCDWSVVYVFVSSIVATTLTVTLLWGLLSVILRRHRKAGLRRRTPAGGGASAVSGGKGGGAWGWWGSCCCDKEPASGSSAHRRRAANGSRYTLLEDDIIKMRARNSLLDSCSDSGSDTEVLFDTRSSNKRHKLQDKHKNGGHAAGKLAPGRLRT